MPCLINTHGRPAHSWVETEEELIDRAGEGWEVGNGRGGWGKLQPGCKIDE